MSTREEFGRNDSGKRRTVIDSLTQFAPHRRKADQPF